MDGPPNDTGREGLDLLLLTADFAKDPGAIATFTDPLFLALTSCVMDRVPPTASDKFPLEYLVDWVRVYEWV